MLSENVNKLPNVNMLKCLDNKQTIAYKQHAKPFIFRLRNSCEIIYSKRNYVFQYIKTAHN